MKNFQNIVFIPVSDIEAHNVSNLQLEQIIADNTTLDVTVTKFTVIYLNTQTVTDLTAYMNKNYSNIDIIIAANNAWITCKIK